MSVNAHNSRRKVDKCAEQTAKDAADSMTSLITHTIAHVQGTTLCPKPTTSAIKCF